jgi:hypothetical protein
MTPGTNRSAERVPVEAFVIVRGERGEELVFRTRDLSEHGLFLYTKVARSYPFKVGSTLHLELYDFDESFECDVVVVRVVEPGSAESERYPTGFGVRIADLDAVAKAKLAGLIGRARSGAAPY